MLAMGSEGEASNPIESDCDILNLMLKSWD